jgi:hypothetical protein
MGTLTATGTGVGTDGRGHLHLLHHRYRHADDADLGHGLVVCAALLAAAVIRLGCGVVLWCGVLCRRARGTGGARARIRELPLGPCLVSRLAPVRTLTCCDGEAHHENGEPQRREGAIECVWSRKRDEGGVDG